MEDLLETERGRKLVQGTRDGRDLVFTYTGGSKRGKSRTARPMGLVRSLTGDYLVAFCYADNKKKRFYIDKINDLSLAT